MAMVTTLWGIGIMSMYLGFGTHCHEMVKINPKNFTTGFLGQGSVFVDKPQQSVIKKKNCKVSFFFFMA